LSGRGLCDELITRPEESYRLCWVVVCDLETSRSSLRVKSLSWKITHFELWHCCRKWAIYQPVLM